MGTHVNLMQKHRARITHRSAPGRRVPRVWVMAWTIGQVVEILLFMSSGRALGRGPGALPASAGTGFGQRVSSTVRGRVGFRAIVGGCVMNTTWAGRGD
jgi:hypothetical protein